MYTRTFIAKEIQPMVESNPLIPLTAIQDVIQKKHQGLIPALKGVLPSAEHRFCLRHIHENMKKEQWRGDLFKNLLWRAITSSYNQLPIGRPRKMRKKSLEEVQAGFAVGGKMTRKGTTNKCSKCGNMGHNYRSCKGQGGTQSESQAKTQSQVEGVTQSDVVGT
ncbi:hypothetical protein QVD17_28363 [Tagetes erecta]|uniref:CCHC-type domain-containing protein n=1 Tax=Tagetes erecta TaxID=13708 RepID=A0AAD8KDP2_TARER|nr:hypothetical protein QVD17_28363 [Tagetes erecta]